MKGINLVQPRLNYNFPLKHKIIALISLFSKSNIHDSSSLNEILKSDKILFFNSGHSALQFFLENLPPHTRVGVQPLTCPTVFESIINAKCEIVFIDINNQLVIDQNSLKNKINDIDVIILTHTFGFPVNVESLKSIVGNKLVIEDCAHAFLSKHDNSVVGKAGDISIFSHGFAKFPSVFNGGYLLINNDDKVNELKLIYDKLSKPELIESLLRIVKSVILNVSNNPLVYTLFTKKIKKNKLDKFEYKYISNNKVNKGYTFSLRLLDFELKNIFKHLNVQKSYGKQITEAIQQNPDIEISQSNAGMNCFMLPAFVKNPEKFIEFAERNGIEVGQHFVQSRKIITSFGYIVGDCENYERIVNELITFPTHYNYPEKKIKQIVKLIHQFKN